MNETPSKGGSYIRNKDGRLKRVASTAPASDRDQKSEVEKPGSKTRRKVKDKDHA